MPIPWRASTFEAPFLCLKKRQPGFSLQGEQVRDVPVTLRTLESCPPRAVPMVRQPCFRIHRPSTRYREPITNHCPTRGGLATLLAPRPDPYISAISSRHWAVTGAWR
jgi:hypothetical protein